MNKKVGIIVNRLVLGFIFAFIYQIVIGIATSLFALPLTGNIQDLISGIQSISSDQGYLFIVWWIISTIIITTIALILVKNRRYLSPYKEELESIPSNITAITAIVIGAIISFWFFLVDVVIGFFTVPGSQTDYQAIYQAASSGDFAPLILSIIFSIIVGFIIVGVASKTARVKELTKEIHITHISKLGKILTKKSEDATTTADTLGLKPGELVHVGEKKVEKISFDILEYDQTGFDEHKNVTIEDCLKTKEKPNISWINISGIHEAQVIENFGKYFGIHPLIQADIMNTELRPKFEVHSDYIYMILKMPTIDEKTGKLGIEQISVVFGKNYVLTFQETADDFFEPIKKRIRDEAGTIRERKSDYIAYAIADTVVDSFFVVEEKISETTEVLEEELMSKPNPNTLTTIHILKRQLVLLRKAIWPMRDVIDSFERTPSQLIEDRTKPYIRDVYNHSIQVMDTVEGIREMVGGMLDTYLSSLSNKMNEVMKTLTIIASIFIPITFIAGIYGTNFEYIPELSWKGSYFVMIGVMVIITTIMIFWFKKKEWL